MSESNIEACHWRSILGEKYLINKQITESERLRTIPSEDVEQYGLLKQVFQKKHCAWYVMMIYLACLASDYLIFISYLYFLFLLMILDPELDKLRNKELSFGCRITVQFDWQVTYIDKINYLLENWNCRTVGPSVERNIISNNWHPLTWWRICHLLWAWINLNTKNIQSLISTRWSMAAIFDYNSDLYDQNELQRMQHEKRPELKVLLKQFAEYI